MRSEDKYFGTLAQDQLWQRYCGFLDLSINDFMDIQEELLMDEIERVADSTLGKKILGDQKLNDTREFRNKVPLTTYRDYEPYLSERQEDALAEKPYLWCHSAGRQGHFKWVPHSLEAVEKAVRNYIGGFILSTTNVKGEINIKPGLRLLTVVAPKPYTSGTVVEAVAERFSLQIMPPLDETETMEFRERIQKGFQLALKNGVDVIGSIASILVKMGEQFGEQTRGLRLSRWMLHPMVLLRLIRAWLHSKREKQPILPKNLWMPKGILVGGLDTAVYKNDVAEYWGHMPYEFFAGTEWLVYAMQAWNKKGMIFIPDMVFLEFLPYDEQLNHRDDSQQPATVLLDEVEEGVLYEVVMTQFYGMPLIRYRTNDVIKFVDMHDKEAGIDLPQMVFQRRIDEVISLAGLARLDEKTVWQAISNTGIKYEEWSARSERDHNQNFIHLYIELKEKREATEIAGMVDEQLKRTDTDYKDIDFYMNVQPVRVTLLSPGTFRRYTEEKAKEGADIAHIKPPHINATEALIQHVLRLSEAIDRNGKSL